MMLLYTALAVIIWNTNVSQIITADAFIPPLVINGINSNRCFRHVSHNDPTLKVQSSSIQGKTLNSARGNNNNNSNKKNVQKRNNNGQRNGQRNGNRQQKGKMPRKLMEAKAINRILIESASAKEVLEYFISKGGAKGIAGGDVFNSVNFSTCMHRLARFATYVDYSKNRSKNDLSIDEKRKLILADPRFAILFASLSEALVQPSTNKNLVFNNRELANLGWAIAKMRLAPPSMNYPIVRSKAAEKGGSQHDNIVYTTKEEMDNDILQSAMKVRREVFEVAKERSATGGSVQSRWIPAMSQLSAKLLDNIASQVLNILSKFNSQELANLLYAFASAGRADVYYFDQLAKQLVENVRGDSSNTKTTQPKPQEFSNSIWAFASAGIRCEGQKKLIECVAETLDKNDGEIVQDFKPQELSNTAWGVATLISKRNSEKSDEENRIEDQSSLRILRWVARSLIERVEDFKPQEISNSIWAFATLGFGATTVTNQFNTNNDYISLLSDQPEEDRKLISEALLVVAKNARTRLYRFRPQELNNMVWGFCRLGHYTDEMMTLYEGVGQEILNRHRYFAPQDIGTTLWSFATMEYFDEAVFKAAASELAMHKSHLFKPQELSNTVWALATAGAVPQYLQAFDSTTVKNSNRISKQEIMSDPITTCFAVATTELIRRPYQFKEQEIKDILWSLSKVGMRHPLVFQKVAEHLVGTGNGEKTRNLLSFSPQGLGNLAWSYAKQAQLVQGGSESLISSTGRLAVYETISLDIGEDLIRRLFTRVAETSLQNGLTRSKPQDLSNTCWAFATLGLLHREFFTTVGDEVEKRLGNFEPTSNSYKMLSKFKTQEIANLLWAFATLNHRSSRIMEHVTPYINYICRDERTNKIDERSIARSFKRQEISNIAWSCSVLEEYPKDLLPLLYMGLFGGIGTDPKFMKGIYGDDGMQRQAVMTMFYVQMALYMEAPELELSLPSNFPMEWKEYDNTNTSTESIRHDSANTSLQLTTSRLQSKVSQALDRLGFDHIDEHVISTNELESDHGVVLSDEDQEFLSIDIADVDNLIGFEVDGPGHFITVLDETSQASPVSGGVLKKSGGKKAWKFTANSKQQMNGPTSLKDRLLQHLGWSVVHVPYWEWRNLNGDKDAEDDYIQNILQDIK